MINLRSLKVCPESDQIYNPTECLHLARQVCCDNWWKVFGSREAADKGEPHLYSMPAPHEAPLRVGLSLPPPFHCFDFSYVCLCSRGPGPADLSVLLFWAVLWPGIESKAMFGVGDRPGGPSCVIRKNCLCVPQRSLKSKQFRTSRWDPLDCRLG